MLEWLKRHAWKACVPQKGIRSSNLLLSAQNPALTRRIFRFVRRLTSIPLHPQGIGFWKWVFHSHYFDVLLDKCKKIWPSDKDKAVRDGYKDVYTNKLESMHGADIRKKRPEEIPVLEDFLLIRNKREL